MFCSILCLTAQVGFSIHFLHAKHSAIFLCQYCLNLVIGFIHVLFLLLIPIPPDVVCFPKSEGILSAVLFYWLGLYIECFFRMHMLQQMILICKKDRFLNL